MTTRVTDLFLAGDHASIPAAAATPVGALYACSTHNQIYKNTGAAWPAWATLAAGSIDAEGARDTIAAALVQGTGIIITVSDGADTITIAVDDEQIRDAIGAALVAGSGVAIVVDDSGNTITVSKGAVTINAQTGTSYTLVLADAPKFVTMTNAAASTLTVPPNSSVAFPVGTLIEGAQLGAGQVTLTPGAGVTINGSPGLKVAAQYGTFGLLKTATDTWLAYGRLAA